MSLQSFFKPKAIAIIGASSDKTKIGRQILDNILLGGFKGNLFPINLREKKIAGLKAYADLNSLPSCNKNSLLVIIAIPAQFVLAEVARCASLGLKNIIIISAGFKEAGKEGAKLEAALATLSTQHNLNILGPNCLGITNAAHKLNATFAASDNKPGRIALVSQSGAIGSAALDWVKAKNLNLAYFISLGNKTVLSENEIIEYLMSDAQVDLIVLYLESIEKGQKLMSLVSRASQTKPVLILKAGQSSAGEKLALSHTGSLTGSQAATVAGLTRAGAILLDNLEDLFAAMMLFQRRYLKTLNNQDLYLITNAGGVAVLTVDELDRQKVALGASFDLLGDADAARYAKSLETVLKNKKINNVLVILTPQTTTEPLKTAQVIIKYAQKYPTKLIMASFMGGPAVTLASELLQQAGVPTFSYPETAVRSLQKLLTYKNNLQNRRIYQAPIIKKALLKKQVILQNDDYLSSLALLRKYKIRTIPTYKYEATRATSYKYPLVLKAVGPDFLHKTDKQAVVVNLQNHLELQTAAKQLLKIQAQAFLSPANYLIVQEMASDFQEIILGFKRDASFGTIMMIGWGGIYAEVFKDIKLAASDVNLSEAKKIIQELKIYPILNGARGQKKYDSISLAKSLVSLAKLANEHPEIKEADINPLFVFRNGAAAADVRFIL